MFLVIASAAATIILGAVWYHPKIFGRLWMRSTNISPEMVENGERRRHLYNVAALLASLGVGGTMRYLEIATHVSGPIDALELGALLWSGLALPLLFGQLLWEQKPVRLLVVNAGYWLFAFMTSALIVSY